MERASKASWASRCADLAARGHGQLTFGRRTKRPMTSAGRSAFTVAAAAGVARPRGRAGGRRAAPRPGAAAKASSSAARAGEQREGLRRPRAPRTGCGGVGRRRPAASSASASSPSTSFGDCAPAQPMAAASSTSRVDCARAAAATASWWRRRSSATVVRSRHAAARPSSRRARARRGRLVVQRRPRRVGERPLEERLGEHGDERVAALHRAAAGRGRVAEVETSSVPGEPLGLEPLAHVLGQRRQRGLEAALAAAARRPEPSRASARSVKRCTSSRAAERRQRLAATRGARRRA